MSSKVLYAPSYKLASAPSAFIREITVTECIYCEIEKIT